MSSCVCDVMELTPASQVRCGATAHDDCCFAHASAVSVFCTQQQRREQRARVLVSETKEDGEDTTTFGDRDDQCSMHAMEKHNQQTPADPQRTM